MGEKQLKKIEDKTRRLKRKRGNEAAVGSKPRKKGKREYGKAKRELGGKGGGWRRARTEEIVGLNDS